MVTKSKETNRRENIWKRKENKDIEKKTMVTKSKETKRIENTLIEEKTITLKRKRW